MKLLIDYTDYTRTIDFAINLHSSYDKSVIFHCYWNGPLNEKHLYSILSCYYFNVHKNKHKIILWLENNIPNQYNIEIEKYAEIKIFVLTTELHKTSFNTNFYYKRELSFYSDLVRYFLLYNYSFYFNIIMKMIV